MSREAPVSILRIILLLFRALFRDRSRLALENLALRQQLAILHRKAKRPRLRTVDRAFWVAFAQTCKEWRSALILVTPETVLRWHLSLLTIPSGLCNLGFTSRHRDRK